MKKIFFLLFFIGISLFFVSHFINNNIYAAPAPICVSECTAGTRQACIVSPYERTCGSNGSRQCVTQAVCTGTAYCWFGSCPAPTPTPTCTINCSGVSWCDTNCDMWNTVQSCPSNTCVKGSTRTAINTSACNGVGGLVCPKPTCTAGTGSTNASCGGVAGYECQGVSTCEQLTYRCSSGSCIVGSHQGAAQSFCCPSGQSCLNGSCSSGAPPNCNSGISCGACSNSCGAGTQTCTYTTLSTGGACTQVPAPSQSCTGTSCGAFCGDGSCNGSETCSSCSTDCGACPPTPTPTPTPIPIPNGNITNLNFGISNAIPWIQTTGGDPYGVSSPIPSSAIAACGGSYMSLQGGGGTPGVVYCGGGSCSNMFGAGQPSRNPYNWQVGGETYSGKLKTSYNTMYSTAIRSGITPTDIKDSCGAGGIINCALSGSIANGVYIANGNLTITSFPPSNTFPTPSVTNTGDFVILVNGDLNINTEIHVPIGSSAVFSASGNINVSGNVGEAIITSQRANIEGYYSTDKSFNVLHDSAKTCPISDLRLNVAGAIVVNAGGTGGTFNYAARDLCAGNLQCPTSTVTERPDFILNSPDFLKSARRVWREIAP